MNNNTPSCSKQKEKNTESVNKNKRKLENQEETRTELETPKENSTKIDAVTEYAKRSRLDFNFWDDSTDTFNNTEDKLMEIKDLKTGNCFGKRLKLRITYKSNVRPGRSGLVFNVHGMDNSSEIGMVCFGNDSKRFYEELTINMVYYLENFVVEYEKETYPSGTGNPLQIKLKTKSKFNLADGSDFPKIVFNLVSLSTIQSLSYNDKVDVLGILVKDNGLETNYSLTAKRNLGITDKSKVTVFFTIWGAEATNFNSKLFSTVIIKRGYVSEYDGTNNINCLYGTLTWYDPQTPEAIDLEKWFKQEQSKLTKKLLLNDNK